MQAEFNGQLIHRRKRYPAELRGVLRDSFALRQAADYAPEQVSQTRALRILRRTRTFVAAIQPRGGENS